MAAPGGIESDFEATIQVTKITRLRLSVTQMTKNGNITVVCTSDESVVLNVHYQVLAVFNRKGDGLLGDFAAAADSPAATAAEGVDAPDAAEDAEAETAEARFLPGPPEATES